MRIKKMICDGEIDPVSTTEELLEQAARRLDKACSHDILGEVIFEGEDGKFYTCTVEAVIGEVNPEYLAEVLEDYRGH